MRVDTIINATAIFTLQASSFSMTPQSLGNMMCDRITVDTLAMNASFVLTVTPKGGGAAVDILIPRGYAGQIECPVNGPVSYKGVAGNLPTAGAVVLQGVSIEYRTNDA